MQIFKVIPLALLLGVPSVVAANDYPTSDRVLYVLNCLQELNRGSLDDLQTCSCRLDSIASEMPFEAYDYAVTYERNKRMTGEKGAIFRDNKAGVDFAEQLTVVEETAKGRCKQVVHIVAPTDLTREKKYEEIRIH